jgi:hypothetical protein
MLAPIVLHLPNAPPLRGRNTMPQRWLNALWLGKQGRAQRQRIVRYFDCTWCSAWGEERSRVSSLSPTGCYIESRSSVPPVGEEIRDLTVILPTGSLGLHGTVIEATRGVGFVVRFTEVDTGTHDRLSALVEETQRDIRSYA